MKGVLNFRKSATLLVAMVLLATHAACTELEGFDDVEDETITVKQPSFIAGHDAEAARETTVKVVPSEDNLIDGDAPHNGTVQGGNHSAYSAFRKPQSVKDVQMEIIFGIFLVAYCVNVWLGRRTNSKIALAWAQSFCGDGCVLDRNFAQIGVGDQQGSAILERVSNSDFKLYATGRRFCTHLSATLSLRRRQDLLSLAWYSVQPRPDVLDIEISMSERAMPPMVLFIGQARFAREWGSKEDSDLAVYSHTIDVSSDRLPRWPSDRLVVMAEHSSLLYDTMTDSMMDQVFANPAFDDIRKYFRYLFFTTEDQASKIPRVLRFSFALPPADKMDRIESLMTAACAFIDIIGCYSSQFTPDQRKRAASKRAEATTSMKSDAGLETALRTKKESEEQERLRKMTPQQRDKYLQKKRALREKRSVKMRKG